NRFFLQTTETGENNGFIVTEGEGTVNFLTGEGNKLKLNLESGAVNQGSNAKLNFAGAENIEMSSNNFTINGINFSLKKEGTITVNVSTDVNGVYEKIKAFVDKYNELIDKIGGELNKKRYRDYLPLTDEQKEAMSEKEVELWEERAKSGLLRNDLILTSTLQSVRLGMYESVSGVEGIYDHLTKIGITTEGYSSSSVGGKLVIDKERLLSAIEKDVDSVLELFFKEPSEELRFKSESQMTAEELSRKRSESGLIGRLYDNLIVRMKEIIVKSGTGDNASLYRSVNSTILVDFVAEHGSISMLDRETLELNKRISNMEVYLASLEEKYWKQFTAMEKALNEMYQQSTWLTQQFSQM
ncbi:MAG TPA: flagellar filament capping protein FliD, partial [Clostridia bacterium]|nr:flagellar filament capping protein FliD [Clostridia bacterium]